MPRKSKALREAQTIELIEKYENAGLGTDRVCNFAKQMLARLQTGKALSTGRRRFLDDVISQGVPEPKGDSDYIAKIDEAIATEGLNETILRDFRVRLVRGWALSEKQKAWCDKLIEKAESIRNGSFWRPDESTTRRIEVAVSCFVCYSNAYWDTHPGGYRAIMKAKQWLAGDVVLIDEHTIQKLFKTVAGKLREMENPRFLEGSIAFHGNNRIPAIVLGCPVPTRNGIAYDVLVQGQIVTTTSLYKRS